MTSIEKKRIDPILRAVATSNFEGFGRVAEALLEGRRRRAPAKSLPTRRAERTSARAERREKIAALRRAVFARDNARCVLCEKAAHEGHHLLFGSGRRRKDERLETMASTCTEHHKAAHDGDLLVLALLEGWCESKGYTEAQADLRRRIEKIERLRGSP